MAMAVLCLEHWPALLLGDQQGCRLFLVRSAAGRRTSMQSAAWTAGPWLLPVADARSRSDQGDVTASRAAHGRRGPHRGVPCSMLSSHQGAPLRVGSPSRGSMLHVVVPPGSSAFLRPAPQLRSPARDISFSSVCRTDCHWCSSCYQQVVAASGLCAPFQLERDNQFQRYPLPQPPPASGSAVKKGFHYVRTWEIFQCPEFR